MSSSNNTSFPPMTETVITNLNNQTILNINMTNVSKLTPTNYLMWSLQVHALVDGYGLIGHLDGSTVIPSPEVTVNEVTSPNPDHTLWKRQDRLLYSALLGAISLPLQPLVSRAANAAQIWETRSATFRGSPPNWISLLFLVNQWIMKIKLMPFLRGFLRSISKWWIRLKAVRPLLPSLRSTRSYFIMKQSFWRCLRCLRLPYRSLGKCQICGTQGHGAKRCPQLQSFQAASQQSPFTPWQPRANMVTANPYNAANWLLDSGATHHITSDLQNLSLSQQGISHLTSPPHTPEHNGVAERKHRHVVETGLTLMSQASMPKTYWPFAFATAVYLINRLPTPNLDYQSPYQKLFQRPPNYHRLRVFGSLCFP